METKDIQDKDKPKYSGNIIPDHEFDGIQELDNPPPPWLMYIFYISIIFSAVYWLHYHVFDQGALQEEEYANEVEKFEAKYAEVKAEKEATFKIELLSDEADLSSGKDLYQKSNCFACHGMNAEGNAIGPNLTDNFAIHGGAIEKVYEVISTGIPAKGMTPFKDQLSSEQILQLSSYIISLQGSNPANAKAPEGEKF